MCEDRFSNNRRQSVANQKLCTLLNETHLCIFLFIKNTHRQSNTQAGQPIIPRITLAQGQVNNKKRTYNVNDALMTSRAPLTSYKLPPVGAALERPPVKLCGQPACHYPTDNPDDELGGVDGHPGRCSSPNTRIIQ